MNERLKILLVDDEADTLSALKMGLEDPAVDLYTATSRHEALDHLKTIEMDIVLTDLRLKDGTGLDILEQIKRQTPQTNVIILTAYGSIETAKQALRQGAYDYLVKPYGLADIKRLIQRLSETIALRRENEQLKRMLQHEPGVQRLIGTSSKLKQILDLVKQVAPSRSTVLITGETGSGKEMVAAAIKHHSPRADKPFIVINCGAIPENLLEAELFGYERGAFTGAMKQKLGKIEFAHEGTLFLDEIGDLPANMQVKLLRVLQNGEFERLGGTRTIKVNVRVIAATNADLKEKVEQGKFRGDLYYRLNVISIDMPPLRDRPEDIPLLAQFFIQKYNQINEKDVQGVDATVLRLMLKYPWQGNVRELENMIERAVVLSKEKILKSYHFPALMTSINGFEQTVVMDVGISLAEIEKKAIERTLQFHDFDKNKTAMTLQIGLATLYRKIKEYGIED